MIKAFIFDIDGTLVDTKRLHIDAWRRTFNELGIDVPADKIQSQLGRRAHEIARLFLPEEKIKNLDKIVERKRSIFREYYPSITSIPKTKEIFDFLHGKGIKLALATSASRIDTEFYIDTISVRSLAGEVICAEDVKHSKPDPEIFLKAAAGLDVKPEESVVVGDSPHDMAAASKGGMVAIGVLTGGYTKEELYDSGAEMVYSDIEDLYNHINGILKS